MVAVKSSTPAPVKPPANHDPCTCAAISAAFRSSCAAFTDSSPALVFDSFARAVTSPSSSKDGANNGLSIARPVVVALKLMP